jgi:hypothetical protein
MVEQQAQAADPLAEGVMDINEAVAESRLSRSYLYERMAKGELKYVKAGSRRLVCRASLHDLLRRGLAGGDRQTA